MTKIQDKTSITNVATTMFKENGFHGTSVRLIAKKLEISVSTIYLYFDSKQDILAHICFDVGKKFLASLHKFEKISMNPGEKLESFIKNHVLIIIENVESIDVYTKEWKYMKPSDVTTFKKQMRQYTAGLSKIISEGIQMSVFVNLNVGLLANFILSAINNFEQLKSCPTASVNTISSDLSTAIVRGLTQKDPVNI